MIGEKEVREVAQDYLEGHEFSVYRSNGGWPTPCGYEVSIIDDIPGSTHTVFIHEDNDYRSLCGKMMVFAENALTEAE